MRWALSVTLAKRHYGHVELHTDSLGKQLLVDTLEIPYDEVFLTLDDIPQEVRPNMWAYGKLVAFRAAARRGAPFLHIDDDVFLFKRLPDDLMKSAVVCQCFEAFNYYRASLGRMSKDQIESATLPESAWAAYNTGIFGGTDLKFIEKYADQAIDLVWSLLKDPGAKEHCNTVFEQAFLAKIARESGVSISTLLDGGYNEQEARKYGFCHLMQAKYAPRVVAGVKERLQREDPKLYERVVEWCSDSVPSLRVQCKEFGFRWRAYSPVYFPNKEARNFNPSLIWNKDRFWLFYRTQPAKFRAGNSEIWASETIPDDHPSLSNHRLILSSTDTHLEDPRLLRLKDGRWLMSFVESKHDFEKCEWFCRQRAIYLDDDLVPGEELDLSGYGANGLDSHEKNWLFFSPGTLRFVYRACPHTVVEVGTGTSWVTEWTSDWKDQFGEIRGGTNPEWKDGFFWSFFHSSLPDDPGKTRRYYMGVYAFAESAPHEVVMISRKPLLTGSLNDVSYHDSDRPNYRPACAFPVSAFCHEGKWTVAMGVNDTGSALVQIDHEQIVKEMVPCSSFKVS